ncbi:DUF6232 family protein [Acetobacter vaccinii]|uniref:Uncharacterized protein n=1 Tax=Acetobacter vaccinii TaxID=2592655 RepID=A0A5C1YRW7_9PROT|nr:DUF6232 family protein [Acetobacter vaccinii]QEO17860.1 hypothetical protein FLP30_09045 [Acetobacter vaccinii]
MREEYFYKEGQISVTKTLIRHWDTSFAVANIDSVSIGKQNTQLYGIGAIILLTFAVIASIAMVTTKKIPHLGVPAIFCVIAAALIIGATLAYLAIKPKFYLHFRSSGGSSKTIETRDYAKIGPLKFAIEQAIISRG